MASTTKDNFAWIRDDIKSTSPKLDWKFQTDTGIPGTHAIMVTVPHLPYPIGIVWFRWRNNEVLDIMNSWVFEPARRCGIRTFIHKQLMYVYPSCREIWSQSATADGAAWMKAAGYKKLKLGWRYLVPKKRKAKA